METSIRILIADANEDFRAALADTIDAEDDGIHADHILTIGDPETGDGPELTITDSTEGIEATVINVYGGDMDVTSTDDAINAASHMTISDGFVCAYSTGNDGLDSNGNMYIKGGVVYAISAGGAEVALDANTEGGYKLYVSGGTLFALGGLEGGAQLTQNCYSASWNKNAWYSLTVGEDTYAFKTPSAGGTPLVVSGASSPSLTSGVSASGGTSHFEGLLLTDVAVSGGTSVTLSAYSGGNGGGGGGGNGPGGGGGHGPF